ncbi:MAG TPA: hypothetical protein DD979_11320 [Gammaproteobacteria bacterium]|jgi:hemin uptake protein HemP|nr:hypothetical protein [Gammaproteobacteria bacterium]
MEKTLNRNSQQLNRDQLGENFVYSTVQLFGKADEIYLNHQGQIYRLRITRQGKLLLTK